MTVFIHSLTLSFTHIFQAFVSVRSSIPGWSYREYFLSQRCTHKSRDTQLGPNTIMWCALADFCRGWWNHRSIKVLNSVWEFWQVPKGWCFELSKADDMLSEGQRCGRGWVFSSKRVCLVCGVTAKCVLGIEACQAMKMRGRGTD